MKSFAIARIAKELNIDRDAASIIRRIVRGKMKCSKIYKTLPGVWRWRQSLYNPPRVSEVRMEAINALMGGSGVEGYEHADSHGCGRYEDYTDYVNMGDAYATTVIHHNGRYWIGCWGDVAERDTATA